MKTEELDLNAMYVRYATLSGLGLFLGSMGALIAERPEAGVPSLTLGLLTIQYTHALLEQSMIEVEQVNKWDTSD